MVKNLVSSNPKRNCLRLKNYHPAFGSRIRVGEETAKVKESYGWASYPTCCVQDTVCLLYSLSYGNEITHNKCRAPDKRGFWRIIQR